MRLLHVTEKHVEVMLSDCNLNKRQGLWWPGTSTMRSVGSKELATQRTPKTETSRLTSTARAPGAYTKIVPKTLGQTCTYQITQSFPVHNTLGATVQTHRRARAAHSIQMAHSLLECPDSTCASRSTWLTRGGYTTIHHVLTCTYGSHETRL